MQCIDKKILIKILTTDEDQSLQHHAVYVLHATP